VLANLSPEASHDVLEELEGEEAREVEALLSFDEDSAGGLMTTDFVYVGETATRPEVVEWVRPRDFKAEQLDTIFLIDGNAKLSGAVALGRLLLASDDQPLTELKLEPLVSVTPDAREKEVFALFDKYNLRSLAVVDATGRPIGAITVDDVITHLRAS
jgi:magnesium transporter